MTRGRVEPRCVVGRSLQQHQETNAHFMTTLGPRTFWQDWGLKGWGPGTPCSREWSGDRTCCVSTRFVPVYVNYFFHDCHQQWPPLHSVILYWVFRAKVINGELPAAIRLQEWF